MTHKRWFEKISEEQWNKDTKELPVIKYNSIIMPHRSTAFSAGYDLFTTMEFYLPPREEISIPTGLKVYMLPDEFLGIIPRSGLGFKYYIRLANTFGVIDGDYADNKNNEGHFWIKIRNEGRKNLHVEAGKAIAQGIFQKYLLVDGDNFFGNVREGGFGHTG